MNEKKTAALNLCLLVSGRARAQQIAWISNKANMALRNWHSIWAAKCDLQLNQ